MGEASSASRAMEPFVSVVVVTHDGADHLARCLASLEALDFPPERLEIVLVDNRSPAGSLDAIRSGFPRVAVVTSAENRGFAGGCNLGIARARGEYVVLLNDDTRVEPGWLRALVDAAGDDPAVGVATSRIRLEAPSDGGRPVLQSTGAEILADGSCRDRGYGAVDEGQYAKREEVFAGCGASMLLRRALLDDVGLLEESLFMYYEDIDLCWRARARGWKIVYVPDSVVWHLHQATMGRGSREHLFYGDRNRLVVVTRNASARRALRAWARYAVGTIPGLSSAPVPTAVRVRAFASALAALPRALASRRRIRRARTASEADLERWFLPLRSSREGSPAPRRERT